MPTTAEIAQPPQGAVAASRTVDRRTHLITKVLFESGEKSVEQGVARQRIAVAM
jgi:hypothetical protein